ncbi:glycosyltransferase involved in cell wall biosynthesis [Rhizobium sp. BK181]|uniref:glycosyltransferase family 4 protein n=1 Tax=Rhizobium sp. BK181 TaxID=2587072 RepID=UPI00160DFEFD|nr:glycosyltransferase family 4 protein [Rhizobium sp. BK181]MBB3319044.1 glycosyltransferase involved in cell wall biosynthesis [Rhizobium sp. BK181]
MRVAFYAPLKSPNHPVPSGDRLMARLLVQALALRGHSVEVISEFRSFCATPEETVKRQAAARKELARLRNVLSGGLRPDLWFCYHPYYKSPDLFGPVLCREFSIPYVTAEASYSKKRDEDAWASFQRLVIDGLGQASVNISLTERDRRGLSEALPSGSFAILRPFIDTALFQGSPHAREPGRLIAVAMMRSGDKMRSYVMLAQALAGLQDRPWTLAIAGDGPMRSEVEQLFSGFGERIEWLGQLGAEEVARELCRSGLYIWPGAGEAYGLAYLEAQAAGLPVVAQKTAGVPEVVVDGETGLLTADGDIEAVSAAIARLLDEPDRQQAMGANARRFVLEERSLEIAAQMLDQILQTCLTRQS